MNKAIVAGICGFAAGAVSSGVGVFLFMKKREDKIVDQRVSDYISWFEEEGWKELYDYEGTDTDGYDSEDDEESEDDDEEDHSLGRDAAEEAIINGVPMVRRNVDEDRDYVGYNPNNGGHIYSDGETEYEVTRGRAPEEGEDEEPLVASPDRVKEIVDIAEKALAEAQHPTDDDDDEDDLTPVKRPSVDAQIDYDPDEDPDFIMKDRNGNPLTIYAINANKYGERGNLMELVQLTYFMGDESLVQFDEAGYGDEVFPEEMVGEILYAYKDQHSYEYCLRNPLHVRNEDLRTDYRIKFVPARWFGEEGPGRKPTS